MKKNPGLIFTVCITIAAVLFTACKESADAPPAHTHSGEWLTVQEADCENDGVKEFRCSSCGEVLDTAVIPALEHQWYWQVTTAATTDEDGLETKTCSRCEAESGETRAIPKGTPSKTVSVGSQDGILEEGIAGSVSYPVTTAGIADGSHEAEVANLPNGVTVSGTITINSDSGTLTIAGDANTAEGTTSTLTLTLDGATSAAFSLVIIPPGNKEVTFDSNGGSHVENYVAQDGEPVPEPEDPVKEGYTFGGWYADNNTFAAQWDFDEPVTESRTLYAKWNPISYTVRYIGNAVSADGTMADSIHVYDVEKALTTNGYTRLNYTFGGWTTQTDGSGTGYANHESVTNLSATAEEVITLYARWLANYTVRYDKNADDAGGTTANSSHNYDIEKALSPNGYGRLYYAFMGWNTQADGNGYGYEDGEIVKNLSAAAGSTVTLYAQWTALPTGILNVATVSQWNAALSVISDGGNFKDYTINIVVDISDSFANSSFGNANGITVTLQGTGRTLRASLGVDSGQTVILKDLTMRGRVAVNGGTFTMNGGEITGGSASNGGGVYVGSNGTFTMTGGKIYGNSTTGGTNSRVYGGGVYVESNGTFTMDGGEISGNTAAATASILSFNPSSDTRYAYGGGVYVASGGTFTMNGGKISDNTITATASSYQSAYYARATASCGGVYSEGTFIMNNGEISGNKSNSSTAGSYSSATVNGGGVHVNGGTFAMRDGIISGNIDNGVTAGYATSTMTGGEISGNTGYGAVVSSGTFRIVNGTIYGSSAAEGLRNSRGASSGIVEYGTFSGDTWNINGNVSSTSSTIMVVNGELQ